MRAYIAIKYHSDHSNMETVEMISSALESHGFETICVARDLEKWGQVQFSPNVLMQRSFDEIDASDILLVDLTEKGVGIGIEAGYAFAKQIPIIVIARAGSDISTTLRGISHHAFLYNEFDDLDRFFAGMLPEFQAKSALCA
ncbi:MAG: nucleoside 2-deoxyribosyltransferase [Proteobacteria bacterium]|nr:nucleoside 2-deoxyribosyltransferase [Pseudomonadota bacterium]